MIYLLHSSVPVGTTGRNAAQHYIGWCEDGDLWRRLARHHSGDHGAAITKAFGRVGGTLYLVRVWPEGGRALERHLKNTGHYKSRCPICQGTLTEQQAVRVDTALSLLTTPDVQPSLRRITRTRGALSLGTTTAKHGLSLQGVLQLPATPLGSGAEPSRLSHGGTAFGVAAPTRPQADASAGTRLPLFAAGKHGGYRTTAWPRPTQTALPLEEVTPKGSSET